MGRGATGSSKQLRQMQQEERKKSQMQKREAKLAKKKESDCSIHEQLGCLAFVQNRWKDALQHYCAALKAQPNNIKVRRYRAFTYVKVQEYEKALKDLLMAIEMDDKELAKQGGGPGSADGAHSPKNLERLCEIYWRMQKYDDALSCLEEARCFYEETKPMISREEAQVLSLIKTTMRMKEESETGQYNMKFLSNHTKEYYDCGEYEGPVEILDVPGKGRGLVATSQIAEGCVILGCKALVFVPPRVEEPKYLTFAECLVNDGHRKVVLNYFNLLQTFVEQMTAANPNLKKQLFTLHAGNFTNKGPTTNDNVLIQRILYYNSKYCLTTPTPQMMWGGNDSDNVITFNSIGLWYKPSFINHSCSEPNAELQTYGDFAIVRTTRPVGPGEEILIHYSTFNSRSAALFSIFENGADRVPFIDFNCTCTTCVVVQQLPDHLQQRKKQLTENAAGIIKEGSIMYTLDHVLLFSNGTIKDEKLLNTWNHDLDQISLLEENSYNLKALYSDPQTFDLQLIKSYEYIARVNAHLALGMFAKASSFLERVFELVVNRGESRRTINILFNICLCHVRRHCVDDTLNWAALLVYEVIRNYGDIDVLPQLLRREYEIVKVPPAMRAVFVKYCTSPLEENRLMLEFSINNPNLTLLPSIFSDNRRETFTFPHLTRFTY